MLLWRRVFVFCVLGVSSLFVYYINRCVCYSADNYMIPLFCVVLFFEKNGFFYEKWHKKKAENAWI